MKQIRTHYDNLQVTRTASAEVITAAYYALSRKYHPDRNLGDQAAAKAMVIINKAYQALCDPERRKAHDKWIVEREREGSTQFSAKPKAHCSYAAPRSAPPKPPEPRFSFRKVAESLRKVKRA